MKGQMYVLTMILLAGLVFAVHGSLSQYAALDLAEPFEKSDALLLESVKTAAERAVAAPTCTDAVRNLAELEQFLERRIIGGTTVDISSSVNCGAWGPGAVSLTIRVRSMQTDAEETVSL